MKPEKYKQKVKEVEFLEVVIRPENIRVEQKKVKAVLDQSTIIDSLSKIPHLQVGFYIIW